MEKLKLENPITFKIGKSAFFNDKKFLSSNDKTLISEMEDLTDVNLAA